ncbi:RsmB/NOP family class I SAM-dependent RNA methyltransferase [bacterium]|nr:RsmB/NOP family class I SAM-dependent RNA methyltransferase [bacterium]
MQRSALIDMTAELLGNFRTSGLPADRALSQFFAQKKFLGSKERRFVGDVFYHAIRHLRRIDEAIYAGLEHIARHFEKEVSRTVGFPITVSPNHLVWANPKQDPKRRRRTADNWIDRVRTTLAAHEVEPGALREEKPRLIDAWPLEKPNLPTEWIDGTIDRIGELFGKFGRESKPIDLARKHSIPEWLWALLGFGLPTREYDAAAAALNENAPTTIRINTLKTDMDAFEAALAEVELTARRGELAQNAFVFDSRLARGALPGTKDGWYEFQDEGSQRVGELIAPQAGSTVIDACAGAGGKTLHFAALMQNQGRIRAYEPSEGRRSNLLQRAADAGVSIVELIENEPSSDAPAQDELADLVLLDVPCSGMGTLRRSPELKWRTLHDVLQQRVQLQSKLLAQWSPFVKVGGRLAYVTCSLLHDENGGRVDDFLAAHPNFQRVDLGLPKDQRTRAGDMQLYPHRHGTDGFFLSVLTRRS